MLIDAYHPQPTIEVKYCRAINAMIAIHRAISKVVTLPLHPIRKTSRHVSRRKSILSFDVLIRSFHTFYYLLFPSPTLLF